MNKKAQYLDWIKWIIAALMFFAFFKYSLDLFNIKEHRPEETLDKVLMNLGIFMIIFLALGIHELGHLLMGLKSAFRFELYVVGLLGVRRKGDKIEFYLNKNLSYFGGVAATSPTSDHPDNARKFAKVLLAGPIASILFTIVCFAAIPFISGYVANILYAGAMVSLAIFIATTLPSRTGMFFTDRKRYQRLVKPGKAQEVELAILKIMGSYAKDNSYKNVNSKDLQTLIEDELPFFQFYGLFNLICYQLEKNGFAEDSNLEDYERISKTMSKSIVASFNKEIDSFKKD